MDDSRGYNVRDRRGATEGDRKEHRKRPDEGSLPDMDFSSFIIFLATTAQMNLGSIPHPETGKTAVDTAAAKQMIDIMVMLKEKTKGNLTTEEDTLLEQVLFNLRMHFTRVVEEQKKTGGT